MLKIDLHSTSYGELSNLQAQASIADKVQDLNQLEKLRQS